LFIYNLCYNASNIMPPPPTCHAPTPPLIRILHIMYNLSSECLRRIQFFAAPSVSPNAERVYTVRQVSTVRRHSTVVEYARAAPVLLYFKFQRSYRHSSFARVLQSVSPITECCSCTAAVCDFRLHRVCNKL